MFVAVGSDHNKAGTSDRSLHAPIHVTQELRVYRTGTSAALHLPPDAEAAEERRKAWQFKVSEGCLSFTSWPHPTRLLGPLASVSVCFLLSLFPMLFFEGLPRAWSSANGLRWSEILHVLHEILHIKWPAVRSLSQYNY